ncbi:MAG: bifunctional phosphoribosylaminoimidazolecarboxamide formyltransferase/IMP cyclohydrolase PurH, partial [Flavobacteriales bacterium]
MSKNSENRNEEMSDLKKVNNALITVFNKKGIEELVNLLAENGVDIYSTGGTQEYISSLGHEVQTVEQLTSFPSIFGGRVKTLHPKVYGGILARRGTQDDDIQLEEYHMPKFDLLVVDLYPFEETVKNSEDENEIIEKVDIGGVSLIRAAAKNFHDVMVVPALHHLDEFIKIFKEKQG